jgi:hypothetical protein
MTFECQCTRIGSLLFPTQESTKQILSRATRIQKIQERQMRVRSKQILGNKIRQFKARANVDMINIFTTHDYYLSRQVMYGDISRWWIAKIYSRSYSQNISIWQRIGIKSHA